MDLQINRDTFYAIFIVCFSIVVLVISIIVFIIKTKKNIKVGKDGVVIDDDSDEVRSDVIKERLIVNQFLHIQSNINFIERNDRKAKQMKYADDRVRFMVEELINNFLIGLEAYITENNVEFEYHDNIRNSLATRYYKFIVLDIARDNLKNVRLAIDVNGLLSMNEVEWKQYVNNKITLYLQNARTILETNYDQDILKMPYKVYAEKVSPKNHSIVSNIITDIFQEIRKLAGESKERVDKIKEDLDSNIDRYIEHR